jgi:hypothetical protein
MWRMDSSAGLYLVGVFLVFFLIEPTSSGSLSVSDCTGGVQSLSHPSTAGNVVAMGTGETTCYANTIAGINSVSNFTYRLSIYQGGDAAPTGTAAIIDVATLAVVASAPITLPTGTTASPGKQVTATFASPETQQLNASRTYYLAFCAVEGTGNTSYAYDRDDSATNPLAFYFCNSDNCTVAGVSTWVQNSFQYTLATNVSYSCPISASPSPSPTPSFLPSPSASPSPQSPSQSPSPVVPTPSPSPVIVAAITANVTASFDQSQPIVDVAASASSSGSSGTARSTTMPMLAKRSDPTQIRQSRCGRS